MARNKLTDRFIASRKNAPEGKRDDYQDAIVPGLALRVTDRGHKSFVLVARYPSNPKNPTRRMLGTVYVPAKSDRVPAKDNVPIAEGEITGGALTLAEARAKARRWLDLLSRGIDPAQQERQQKIAAKKRITFDELRDASSTIIKAKQSSPPRRASSTEISRRGTAGSLPISTVKMSTSRSGSSSIAARNTKPSTRSATSARCIVGRKGNRG